MDRFRLARELEMVAKDFISGDPSIKVVIDRNLNSEINRGVKSPGILKWELSEDALNPIFSSKLTMERWQEKFEIYLKMDSIDDYNKLDKMMERAWQAGMKVISNLNKTKFARQNFIYALPSDKWFGRDGQIYLSWRKDISREKQKSQKLDLLYEERKRKEIALAKRKIKAIGNQIQRAIGTTRHKFTREEKEELRLKFRTIFDEIDRNPDSALKNLKNVMNFVKENYSDWYPIWKVLRDNVIEAIDLIEKFGLTDN